MTHRFLSIMIKRICHPQAFIFPEKSLFVKIQAESRERALKTKRSGERLAVKVSCPALHLRLSKSSKSSKPPIVSLIPVLFGCSTIGKNQV
ncbi:MAG: hypothetical protein LBJ67_08400 [Planctomycetaceae bacterium]|jgi:hypothetical protein|nr:hypothetical protein [Planctomycetaceae bacterium]